MRVSFIQANAVCQGLRRCKDGKVLAAKLTGKLWEGRRRGRDVREWKERQRIDNVSGTGKKEAVRGPALVLEKVSHCRLLNLLLC